MQCLQVAAGPEGARQSAGGGVQDGERLAVDVVGGQPPYGLAVDPDTKKLVHAPDTAVHTRLIADEALSGKALVHIAAS
ncbi:hypothetical protein ACWEPB_20825 [Kitasatospora cineracea]